MSRGGLRIDWGISAARSVEGSRVTAVKPGLTLHGLRVSFAAEVKRVTGANGCCSSGFTGRPSKRAPMAGFIDRASRDADGLPMA